MTSETPYDLTGDPRAAHDRNHPIGLALDWIGTGRAVLELGSATGYVTRLLSQERGCTVTGVEYMPEAAERARPFAQRLIVGDVEAPEVLAQLTGPYDVILAGDLLEHLRAPERLLAALRPALAPGGGWVISVPNVAHWSVRKELLLGRFDYTARGIMDRSHLRWFTRRSLARMLAAAGYRVQRLSGVYTLPLQDQLGLRGLAARLRERNWLPGLLSYQIVAQAAPA